MAHIFIIGSGATVYVLLAGAQGINASLTVDGGPPAYNVLAPVAAPDQKVNISLFDVQSLNMSAHTLTLSVLDWNGTFSGMMFDYIAVNQTAAATPATSTSSESTTATPSASSNSPSHST